MGIGNETRESSVVATEAVHKLLILLFWEHGRINFTTHVNLGLAINWPKQCERK